MGTIRELTKKNGEKTFHAEVRRRGYPPQRESFRTRMLAKKWIQDTEAAIRDGRFKSQSAARRHTVSDLICFCGSPNFRTLVMQCYIALKEGLTHEQMLEKWAREDSMLYLDTIDVRVIQNFEKQRIKYYEELLEKICNVTILDPGPEYEHSFCNKCYQKEVQTLVERYKKIPKPATIISANTIAMDCVTV